MTATRRRTGRQDGSILAGVAARRPAPERRWLAALAVAAAGAVVLAGCSSSAVSGSTASKDFVIGTVEPLTGAFAGVGVDALNGIKAEAAILNADGGILGHKVKVISLDDGSDVQRGLSATKQILSQDHVDLFIPDTILANTQLPVAKSAFATDFCSQAICGDGSQFPLAFSVNVSQAPQTQAMVAYAKQQGYTKIGVIAQDTSDGSAFADTVKKDAASEGLQVVGVQSFDPNANDVSTQIQQLRAAGADTVFAWAIGTTIGTAMRGVQSVGWDVPVVGSNADFTGPVAQIVPTTVQPQLTGIAFLVGTRLDGAENKDVAPLVAQLKKLGTINNLSVAAFSADSVVAADYAYTKVGHLGDMKAAAAALGKIGSDSKYPASKFWVWRNVNPNFHGTVHNGDSADLSSGIFSKISVSAPTDGAFNGEAFNY